MAKDKGSDKGTDKDEDLTPEEKAALKQTKTTHGVSEEELEGLSAEERAAIEEEDDDAENLREIAAESEEGAGEGEEGEGDEPKAKDKKKAKDADPESKKKKTAAAADAEGEGEGETEGEGEAEGDAEGEGEDEGKDKKKGAAKADAEEEGEEEGEDDIDVPLRPRMARLNVKPVEKFDEKMKALDDDYDATLAKYKEGDLAVEDLLKKERELNAKRAELREAKLRADLATEHNDNTGKAEWMGDIEDFFTIVKAKEGIDYSKRALNVAFDDALKGLAVVDANQDKSEAWFLREAHKLVKADLGLVAKKPAADDKSAAAGDKGKKVPGRTPKLALVPDLGKIPGSGGEEDGEDAAGGDAEFVNLDKLVGQEYEDALARMSPAKQEKYLRAR